MEFAVMAPDVPVHAGLEDRYNIALYFLDVVCAPIPIVSLLVLAAFTVVHTVTPVVASGSQETAGTPPAAQVPPVRLNHAFGELASATRVLKYSVVSGSTLVEGVHAYSDNELYNTVTDLEVVADCAFTYCTEVVLFVLMATALAPLAPLMTPEIAVVLT
jgi:hypothetical protein